ncbi:hypothetical protein BCR44DRAFT_42953 [Catenaria anguillulae PL171]|uniref:Uncharacterized protein n=1 Tax=Catenaria anguillulae PL171 TaxID=765915 RepID=A0A1Y2HGN3_9FUNG|nr:hypothetical protein BCR44DRAFT_42953 [Catenaria anguillulae PL171]
MELQFQDGIQLALITCLVFVVIVFLWLTFPSIKLVRDPTTRWPRLQVTRANRNAAESQRSLRRMMQRRNRQDQAAAADEPLPKYSLRGIPGAGVSLQLGSPVEIDERSSGAIVVRAVQPVVASGASLPIALPEEHAGRHVRTSQSRSSASAAELYVEPVSPGITPSGPLPVVHVMLSLPPPPVYGDKSGVPIEVGEGVGERG